MPEVIVTRGGQVTLTKDVRTKLRIQEGDTVIINTIGDTAIISKRDASVFNKHNFLPENFDKTLSELRSFSPEERMKRLGIL